MKNKTKNQILALAGILQAAELINELATHGNYNASAFKTSIESIYQLEAQNVESIYTQQGLLLGLSTLEKLLTQEKVMLRKNSLRYFFNLLHIERKWIKQPALMKKLNEAIHKIKTQFYFMENPIDDRCLADLADAYTTTIKKFNVKIIIRGNQHYLTQRDNLNKIRSLLLAGIRSVVLWRQLGGNRWQLLFGRNKLLKAVQSLLS